MSDYYIKAVLLEECQYSIAAENLFKNNNIMFENIKVNYNNKNDYKTNLINTFPQIYLCKNNNNGTQLLGGYDDINSFISNFKGKQYNEQLIQKFMDKYSMSKKAILRLIQLIN